MKSIELPEVGHLHIAKRYARQNMGQAMRGDIRRGLVELITNADDSYRALEDEKKKITGKIRIEVTRRRKDRSSFVVVRDRAAGMNREEMRNNLLHLGGRASDLERNKDRRGFFGRGAKDVAAFGKVHFESIKNNIYNELTIFLSTKYELQPDHRNTVTSEIRERLGIPRGNGTVVTIEISQGTVVPLHETLLQDLSSWYSLRDICSSLSREVKLFDVNSDTDDLIKYTYPNGEIVVDEELTVPDYPDATFKLVIVKHDSAYLEL